MRRRSAESGLPTAYLDSPSVQTAVAAIRATEAGGGNLTEEQYRALEKAISDVLRAHPELLAQPPVDLPSLDIEDGVDRGLAAWLVAGEVLHVVRGPITSPSGAHGPWPGTRCVYCGSNNLDVDLYTVDRQVCPPVWACCNEHPERDLVDRDHPHRWAHCGLAPDHAGAHQYEMFDWPTAYRLSTDGVILDEDNLDVRVEGPPQLTVITWPRTDDVSAAAP